MDNKVKKHNLKIIRLMREQIERYTNLKLSLGDLVNDLYALSNDFEVLFIEGFNDEWIKLEGIYAGLCCNHRNYYTSEEPAIICDGLIGILRLINVYEKKYLSDCQE
jgi:hypothetical protein